MRGGLLASILAAAIALFGYVDSADAGRRLSGKELRSMFKGTITGLYKNKTKITIKTSRKGNLIAYMDGKVDTGNWQIRGNQVCISFKVWTKGKFKCRYVERDGDWFKAVKANGKSKMKFRR